MRPVLRLFVIVSGFLTILSGLDRARLVGAEEKTTISHSKRGGTLVATEGYRFEVFFYPTGVRVFPVDAVGNAVDTSKLTAGVTVDQAGAPRERRLSLPLHPVTADKGAAPSSLVASIGLADAPQMTTIVVFEIAGLPGPTASTAAFKLPLEFVAKAIPTATATPTPTPTPTNNDTNVSAESGRNASPGYDGGRPDVAVASRTSSQPAEAAPGYVAPRMTSGSNTSRNATSTGLKPRDWTTGRTNLPLAKPWLLVK